MRKKTKRRLLLIVSLMTAIVSLGALASSASPWGSMSLSTRTKNHKQGKPEQAPSPQPTPVTDTPLPPAAPPSKHAAKRSDKVRADLVGANSLTAGTLTGRMAS